MNVCALDYIHASDPVQAAIDAARAGDRVYIPGANGPPFSHQALFEAPTGGWRVRKSLEVYGDGPGHSGNHDGSTLSPGGTAPADDVFVIDPTGASIEYVHLHGFMIRERVGLRARMERTAFDAQRPPMRFGECGSSWSAPARECCSVWNDDGMGLSQCTSYFYAIKYKDTALGWSPMSNGAASMTLCSGFFEVECA